MTTTKFGLDQQAIGKAGGTEDMTETSFGTCNGAITFGAASTSLDTHEDHAQIAIGGNDGSTGLSNSIWSRHGVGTTFTKTGNVNGSRCLRFGDNTSNSRDGHFSVNAFITDGVRLNVSNTFADNNWITALLVACAEFKVVWHVDTQVLDQESVAVPHGLTGGAPDAVIAIAGHERAFSVSDPASGDVDARLSIGFVANRGASVQQASGGWGELDNQSAGSPECRVTATRFLTAPNAKGSFECTGLDATNLDYTYHSHSDNCSPCAIQFIFLRFDDGAEANVGVFDTPTSVGTEAETGLDVDPDVLFLAKTMVGTLDTDVTGAFGGSFGFGVATATAESSMAVAVNTTATSDTSCVNDDELIELPYAFGTTGYRGSLSSFDAGGFTLQFDNVTGFAHKWPYLVVGQPTGGGTSQTAGTSSGTSTATAVGSSKAETAGTAAGTTTATAVGTSKAETTGTSAGTATAAAVGQSTARPAGTATGTATATAVGSSKAETAGTAAGTATATAVGDTAAIHAGDTEFATVKVTTPASPGTLDVTVPGFNCVGAKIVCSWGTTLDTDVAGRSFSYGVTDGTTDVCSFSFSKDNVATSDARCGGSNLQCILLRNPDTAGFAVLATASLIAGGVRLDFSITAVQVQLEVVLIDAVNFKIGTSVSQNPHNNTDNVVVGWQPDVLEFMSLPRAFDGVDNQTRVTQCHGWCDTRNLKNRHYAFYEEDNHTNPQTTIYADEVDAGSLKNLDVSDTPPDPWMERLNSFRVTAVDATSFTVTHTADAGALDVHFCWIAYDIGDDEFAAEFEHVPHNVTGLVDFQAPGFRPHHVELWSGEVEGLGNLGYDLGDGVPAFGTLGIAHGSANANDEASVWSASEYEPPEGPTNTGSRTSSEFVQEHTMAVGDFVLIRQAAWNAWLADGVQVDFSVNIATGNDIYWLLVAFGLPKVTGTAVGTSTATAVGSSKAEAAGTATGTATAVAVGASTFKAVGATAGTSTATAVGSSKAETAGTSAGAATAVAVGASKAETAGTAAGTATATASSAGTTQTAGTSAGTATATAVGQSTARPAGTVAGFTLATAVGSSKAETAGTSAGAATAVAVGASKAETAGTAAGTATATAVGSTAEGDQTAGSTTGIATATAVGSSTARAAAQAAGTATATAVIGTVVRTAGTSTGTATASAVGVGVKRASGTSAGVAAAAAVGQAIARASALASGLATAQGVGSSKAETAGTAAGTATATASTAGTTQTAGTSTGTATASAVGRAILKAVAEAQGTSAAAAVGQAIARASALASGLATVQGVGRSTALTAGQASGVATATALLFDAAVPPELLTLPMTVRRVLREQGQVRRVLRTSEVER